MLLRAFYTLSLLIVSFFHIIKEMHEDQALLCYLQVLHKAVQKHREI